jgi:broad specificity phosphatase PhoE
MKTIYLVRHAQDEDNAHGILNGRRDMSLTSLGREQAQQVAEKLKDKNINVIYCGPQKRHRETAQAIAELVTGVPIIVRDDLIERDFGVLTGKPVADIPKYSDKVFAGDRVTYFLEAEGAESFGSLFQRASVFLQELRATEQRQHVLVVTSSDIGKMIQAVWGGWSWQEALRTPYFNNTDIIELN